MSHADKTLTFNHPSGGKIMVRASEVMIIAEVVNPHRPISTQIYLARDLSRDGYTVAGSVEDVARKLGWAV